MGWARGGVGERWGAREVGWAPGEGRQPAGWPADVGYAGKRDRRVEGEVPTGVKSRPHARGVQSADRCASAARHSRVRRTQRAGGRGRAMACNGVVQWRAGVRVRVRLRVRVRAGARVSVRVSADTVGGLVCPLVITPRGGRVGPLVITPRVVEVDEGGVRDDEARLLLRAGARIGVGVRVRVRG